MMLYPPGPNWPEIFGTVRRFRRDPLATLTHLTHQYGDMSYARVGAYHFYLLNNAELVHNILSQQANQVHKSRLFKRSTISFLGNGLLVSEDDLWQQQRKLMRPAFHQNHIANYAQIMASYAEEIVEKWMKVPDTQINIDHEMMELTSRIVAKTLFGIDVSTEAGQIIQAVNVLQAVSTKQAKNLIPVPSWSPLPENQHKQTAIRTLKKLINQIVADRRMEKDYSRGDLLSMLLQAVDESQQKASDKQICDEMMNLFLAGHDSTANVLTWAWYLLARHAQVEANLHQELDTHLKGHLPTASDLPHLPYTEAILKETMRLYPPAWLLAREPKINITLGKYTVPKKSTIFICPPILHRDARYFSEPEHFYPERFANESMRQHMRHAYIPFGDGPRYCIGSNFAMMEGMIVLATIARRCTFQLTSNTEISPAALLTLRPAQPIHVRVSARKSIPQHMPRVSLPDA